MKKLLSILLVLCPLFLIIGCGTNSSEKTKYKTSPTEEIKSQEVQGEWTGVTTGSENTEYMVFLDLNADGSFFFEEINTDSSGNSEVIFDGVWHIESDQLILDITDDNQDGDTVSENETLKLSYEVSSDSLTLEHNKQIFSLVRKDIETDQ